MCSPVPASLEGRALVSSMDAAQAWHVGALVLLPVYGPGGLPECDGTCGAIVGAYAEFVQTSAVLNGELVVVGEHSLLAVPHVHAQLVAALGREPVYVVQPCGEEQSMQGAWPRWLWKREGKWGCGLETDVTEDRRGTSRVLALSPSPSCYQTLPKSEFPPASGQPRPAGHSPPQVS